VFDIPELDEEFGLRLGRQRLVLFFGGTIEKNDDQYEKGLRSCKEVRLIVRRVLRIEKLDGLQASDW
jgi:hypothetical protein